MDSPGGLLDPKGVETHPGHIRTNTQNFTPIGTAATDITKNRTQK